ncbi:alpha/beta hydrolase [uncultured Roseobacter sp.]|uniref:alpha/beta fold hydrolase n=1 Tax=uncultured Roseobacter sp. TaxID=114847 RepID=UPI0026193EBD|nr:alpha/beta hydrolase [uncultured Roseobacter sp.]
MIWLALLAALITAPLLVEAMRKPMGCTARASAPGQCVALSQGTTHFRWVGPPQGPVILCIHGLTTPSFVWGALAAGLSQAGFRVLTYDLYGRGFSDRPAGPQDAAFFLRQVDDLLVDQDITAPVTLIGYSMGGAIAAAFAARHPARVRRLLLLAPAGMLPVTGGALERLARLPLFGGWLMLALYPAILRRGLAAERGQPDSVPEINRQQRRELRWRGFVPAVRASLLGLLSEVLRNTHGILAQSELPVLALWGQEDAVIPLRAADTLQRWNPASQSVVVPGAGHGLPYTHSDAVLAHILRFLRGD